MFEAITIRTTLRPILLVSGFLSIALAGEPVLTREGKYWVEVRSGSEAMAPAARLRIASREQSRSTARPVRSCRIP